MFFIQLSILLESHDSTPENVLKHGNIKVADANKEKQKIKMTYINGQKDRGKQAIKQLQTENKV